MEPTARLIRKGQGEGWSDGGVEMRIAVSQETTGARGLLFAIFTSDPGIAVPPHTHTCDTAAYLTRGRAAFTVEGERWEMEPGDVIYVPAGVVHTEETLGDERAEFILARDAQEPGTIYLDEGAPR